MSAVSQLFLPIPLTPWRTPGQVAPPTDDQRRVVSTRNLWQRTMPDAEQSEQGVLNESHPSDTKRSSNRAQASLRRRSSLSLSSLSEAQLPSPSAGDSKGSLTPEESPSFRPTRKRTAGIVEEEDKESQSADASPANTGSNSDHPSIHVCICQPDPKIPRPRNAFILYRQHHQASVVAQHPGLANPEISKIIGEQWQNQTPDIKNKWKALAEEEKLRHQQQYPTYRYQPKRNGRRNSPTLDGTSSSAEELKCKKCGGRSILAPSAAFIGTETQNNSPISIPNTPGASITTPVTRTIPVLRNLSLHSPAQSRATRQYPGNMPHGHVDDRDDVGPLTSDNKRRRYNSDHPPSIPRAMPPRYAVAPGGPVPPGTPFPFSQLQAQPALSHPYPAAATAQFRRESLPALRGMASPPMPMAPPPRPSIGYAQHRLSQGQIQHDRSLTLPPLQTSNTAASSSTAVTPSTGKTAKDQILEMDFRHRINILKQMAPPQQSKKSTPRGPLVAIEGDDVAAVVEVGNWLRDTLSVSDDLSVKLIDGPAVSADGNKEMIMVAYHKLCAEWLVKSIEIKESLKIQTNSPTDSVMKDAPSVSTVRAKNREIDEDYDEESDGPEQANNPPVASEKGSSSAKSSDSEKMDVDTQRSTSFPKVTSSSWGKPVAIIPNFTVYASIFYACNIPLASGDPYSPQDHWAWTATQWRGVISPDLTIYVRDSITTNSGKPTVEILEERNLFVVKRTKSEEKQGLEMEASVLRRLGFEVSEWVRAFGSQAAE